MTLPMCLCLGLSGMIGVGVDIGGFNLAPTAELFVWWLQCGVFLPFCRVHSSIQLPDQEPWSFGERAEVYARDAITLRYRLLPYLYTWLRYACCEGVPLLRPLWMDPDFAADTECFDPRWEETQAMIGPHLLLAPIVDEGAQQRQVYLPRAASGTAANLWVDFYTREVHEGGSVVTVDAPMALSDEAAAACEGKPSRGAPLFVRAGAVVPMKRNVGRSTADYPLTPGNLAEELEFVHFKACVEEGEEDLGCGMLYVDDGISMSFMKDGRYGLYKINARGIHQLVEGKVEW